MNIASLFVSHGAPTLPISDIPARAFLKDLGVVLPHLRAIVALSPHWPTRDLEVKSPAVYRTWHDFGGFPDELYRLGYTPPGEPAVALRVIELLREAGIASTAVADDRLDHGVWVPLLLAYPHADVPVVQVSSTSASPRAHYELGRALRPLTQEGVLVLGTGGAVHNLGALDWGGDSPPQAWASGFDDWLHERVLAGDWDALCDYRKQAPQAERAHPHDDHFLPLFFAGGAGGAAMPLHRSFSYGNLSMAAYAFAL